MAWSRASSALRLRKDHPPGHRLQHAGDRDLQLLVQVAPAALDDDHGAVVQEAHTLAHFLPLLDDAHRHLLARQDYRLHSIGEAVHVQHLPPIQLSDPVQVEVVREDRRADLLAQLQELAVDVARLGEVIVGYANRPRRFLLQPRKDMEAATAAVAAERIRRIGDVAQFVEHKARDDQRALEETRGHHVGHPPVDDRARIDDDLARGAGPGARQQADNPQHQLYGVDGARPLLEADEQRQQDQRRHQNSEQRKANGYRGPVKDLDQPVVALRPRLPRADPQETEEDAPCDPQDDGQAADDNRMIAPRHKLFDSLTRKGG